jgi:hypothetical protein
MVLNVHLFKWFPLVLLMLISKSFCNSFHLSVISLVAYCLVNRFAMSKLNMGHQKNYVYHQKMDRGLVRTYL